MTNDVRAHAQHLLHLLNMLPSRTDATFWKERNDAENAGNTDDYFVSKMLVIHRMLREELAADAPSPTGLHYLAQYVLMFFDRDNPRMWKVLDHTVHFSLGEDGRVGRRWAEDACRTAWALYSYGWGSVRDDEHPETERTGV